MIFLFEYERMLKIHMWIVSMFNEIHIVQCMWLKKRKGLFKGDKDKDKNNESLSIGCFVANILVLEAISIFLEECVKQEFCSQTTFWDIKIFGIVCFLQHLFFSIIRYPILWLNEML